MKFLILMTILISSVPTALANKIEKSYRPMTYVATIDDDQTEARIMGFGLDGRYTYELFSDIVFDVQAGVRLEAGSNNSLNLKEYSPNQEIVLQQGTLNWNASFFEFQAGAINQSCLDSPLLTGGVVFIGFKEKMVIDAGVKLFISSQQSIPYNQTLNQRSGGIEEGTPSFFYHQAGLMFANAFANFEIKGGLYKYNNLSSAVANQSRYMGNEVVGSGSLSRFLYDFEGTNLATRIELGKNNIVQFNIDGQYLYNDKAPDSSNTGHLLRGMIIYEDYGFGGELFENGANASPGYYNSKSYGHNSREGQAIIFNINRIQKNWNLESRFALFSSTDPSNLLISDGQLFTLNFSRSFGKF
jgi:hypothetical protein